jgi:hypothetical protein
LISNLITLVVLHHPIKEIPMEYKNDMRRLIDIVKQSSMSEPLESALEDLKTLSSATKDLSDRIEIRVRKSLVSSDKDKGKVEKGKKIPKKVKPFPSVSTAPKPKPQSSTQSQKALPTSQQPTSVAISQADINRSADNFKAQQQALAPITPKPPM